MGKISRKVWLKKKNLVSTVPCRRTAYRMVGNAESRALIAGQNVKSTACDFLGWGTVYIRQECAQAA